MFILHICPRLQFKLISCEKWELKSEKEHSFLSKLNSNLVNNLIIMPLAVQLVLFQIFGSRNDADVSLWLLTLQSMPSLVMRTLMHVTMAVALN